MLTAYYKFIVLSPELKQAYKIRSPKRYDCIEFSNDGNYKGLDCFISKIGQMYFYLSDTSFIKYRTNNADFCLIQDGINFSSLLTEDKEKRHYYGYPNSNKYIKKGLINPLFGFKNDCYLFRINDSFTEIEVFILRDCKPVISSLYQKFLDGGFDLDMVRLKGTSKTFFNYSK